MRKLLCIALLGISAFAGAQQKVALVIGNGDYTGIAKLRNPVNDARDVAEALQAMDFAVEQVINGNLDQMETAAMNLKHRLGASRDTYGFFFYAGHGVQSGGDNYLIPVDAGNIASENHLRQRAFSVQTLLDNLSDARNELNIIVLDACRDNPFGWARSGRRGLTLLSSAPAGSIVMYATSANSTADDGAGQNGLFTSQLLHNLKTPGLSVRDIFDKTGEDVLRVSNGKQHPELSIRYFGASAAYLDSRPDSPGAQAIPQPTAPEAVIADDFIGAWFYDGTTITFTPGGFSVRWQDSHGVATGYTVSVFGCTAAVNTTGQNRSFLFGYRLTGRIIQSTVPSLIAGNYIDRSYFFDGNKTSFWNSESTPYIIYRRQ